MNDKKKEKEKENITQVKKILDDIGKRLYSGKEVTPDEVRLHCLLAGGIITAAYENGEVIRLVVFCPTDGFLNICIFDFDKGKGKRVAHTRVLPDIEHSLLWIIKQAKEKNREGKVENDIIYH